MPDQFIETIENREYKIMRGDRQIGCVRRDDDVFGYWRAFDTKGKQIGEPHQYRHDLFSYLRHKH